MASFTVLSICNENNFKVISLCLIMAEPFDATEDDDGDECKEDGDAEDV